MKKIYARAAGTISVLLLAILLIPFSAFAAHNACRIKAGNDDVLLRVFNLDQDGNPIRNGFSDGEIYRGVVKKGQSIKIESSHGRINYSYRSFTDDRNYGGNLTPCSHGEVIRIP
ncbi:MAG: hypothetical protein R3274_06170 [Desulfobacterales bacterium]|nr:hypothetical protein [Desulfobacterales bacterium]